MSCSASLRAWPSSGPGSWVFQRTLYPIDKQLYRLTKGRLTVPGLMAGLPVIILTTTGAKTGKDRTMPLVGIPMGDDMAIIGSNYGQESTPGWVYNLRAKPEATVAHGSDSVEVIARSATEAETERAFEAGTAFYGGFSKYRREHLTGRSRSLLWNLDCRERHSEVRVEAS